MRARATRVWAAVAIAPLGVLLALAVLEPPGAHPRLAGPVGAAMERSGVEHPVTAVLLNFRAYDTWLELAVLLVAVLAVLTVRRATDLRAVPVAPASDPVLAWLARLVVPAMVVAAGYLLWLGTHAPGGAFQAGAVLGAAGVLLLAAGHPSVTAPGVLPLRLALSAGTAAFLLVGGLVTVGGRPFLAYPPRHAGTLILLIEAAATVSIAFTLTALFAGARAGRAADGG